jgi:O-antigen ligase
MTLASLKNRFDSSTYVNYLLVAYAFFLPISPKTASILMTFIALLTLISGNLKERFLHVIQDKIVIAFVLFYVMHFIWLIGSEHLHIALLKIKEFQYILYIVIIAMILKKKFIIKILSAFLLAMLFSETMSYAMYFNISVPFIHLNIENGSSNVPFMLSYTQYGTILSISLGMILYTLQQVHQVLYPRILYSIFFISASINIFFIGSRIGYTLYFISIATVLFFIYRDNVKKAIFLTLILSLTGFITAYNYGETFNQRSKQLFNDIVFVSMNDLSTSLGIRTGYYIYGWKVIQEYPLFGLGTGDHIAAVEEKILALELNTQNENGLLYALRSGHNASLHSEYLDTTIQFGFIGLLIFLNIFYQILKYYQKNPDLRIIQLILFFNMLFFSIGSTIFIARDVGTIFILLIALTLNIKPLESMSVREVL